MLIRPALVSAAAVAIAIVPLASAGAAAYRHVDARRDVRTFDLEPDSIGAAPTFTPAPDATQPDVTAVRVVHGPRRLAGTMQLAALTRSSQGVYEFEVRTNEKQNHVVDLVVGPKHWQGRVTLDGGIKRCKGLTHAIDYAADRVAFGIPRGCLGDPRWVRVAAVAVHETVSTKTTSGGSQSTTTITAYVDDAQSSTFRNRETWSPRIRKG
jgi:hypothetical protein